MVFVIAATNRPDIIDKAMLRPGRLDKMLYVPLPNEDDRVSILKTLARSCPLKPDVDIEKIAKDKRCDVTIHKLNFFERIIWNQGFSGADLSSLVKEAALNSIKRDTNDEFITFEDFDKALDKVQSSNSETDRKQYEYVKYLQ